MNRTSRWVVILVILVIASIHSFIPEQYLTLHIILRLLYFIPIIYMALSGGRKVGAFTALTVSLIFLPHFFIAGASPEFIAGNIVAVVLFNLSGFFIGMFRESSETELSRRILKTQIIQDRGTSAQKVLFYTDDTPLTVSAAEWFMKRYGRPGLSFMLVSVSTESREETEADRAAGQAGHEKDENTSRAIDRVKHILADYGVKDEAVQTVFAAVKEKVPVSSKIIELADEYGADTILLCKHNKKKAEEFLFGDTAIQLVRRTSIPVIVAKGVEERMSSGQVA